MYESNTVLNVAHHLFIVCFFCRIRQHSLPANLINSLYVFKVSTVKWPFGVNVLPNECTAVSKTAPFIGNPCNDAERCTPFILSPWDGPFTAGMGYIGIRHTYGLYRACSKARELQTLNSVNSASFNVQTELKEYWSSYDHYENVPKLSLMDRIVILVRETRLYSSSFWEEQRALKQ